MSYAPIDDAAAPWVDAENGARILRGKGRPFVAEGKGR
jgi:hypothetical protein